MKLKFYILILMSFLFMPGFGQSVDEILRNAKTVGSNDKIFIQFEKDNTLQFSVGSGDNGKSSNSLPFDKSHPYFLIKNSAVNIYLRPVNPLNYSVDAQLKYTADSLSIKLNDALTEMQKAFSGKSIGEKAVTDDCDSNTVVKFSADLDKIRKEVQIGQVSVMVRIFTALKGLSFETQDETVNSLKR